MRFPEIRECWKCDSNGVYMKPNTDGDYDPVVCNACRGRGVVVIPANIILGEE